MTSMAREDDEIEKSRQQEQAGASAAKREASQRRKILKVFSQKALRGLKLLRREEETDSA
jgi:hypothetical protein